MIEAINQRPTAFQYALAAPSTAPRADQDAVGTELDAGLTVTATEAGGESDTATDKSYASDSRSGATEQVEKRLVRERGYDEEIREFTYTLKQEPSGEVIFEIPTETARRISTFIDQLITLQEQEKAPEIEAATVPSLGTSSEETSPEVQEEASVEAAVDAQNAQRAAPQQTDPLRTAIQAAA
ncbi:hypothetical protein PUV47_10915 [Pseudovibrio exalbescens]|uniref:hypothetical protein n=1 Tax=Pseudovibrio exalbescens TaxID=197461 RepID=UPI00236706A0|nr:hypothetical protein [Pseudovibrio exalbescens]MDD7910430.1 hypothetical protein [Pseudovibrio exalbescens]